MGEAIIARRGGASGYKPKIYVQAAQPTGKNGEFWVQDSGYTLDSIVTNTVAPATPGKNALYLQISTSLSRYNWVVEKNLDITSCILYGQTYYGGWRNSNVYLYSGGWQIISKNGNRLYFTSYVNNTTSDVGELDPVSLAIIRAGVALPSGSSWCSAGGIRNRLFLANGTRTGDGGIFEVDVNSGAVMAGKILSPAASVGGTSSRLFGTDGRSYVYELDPSTLVATHTVTPGYPYKIDGIENTLFLFTMQNSLVTLKELDQNTLVVVRASVLNLPNSGDGSIAGLRNQLFIGWDNNGSIYRIDIATLTILSYSKVARTTIGGTK